MGKGARLTGLSVGLLAAWVGASADQWASAEITSPSAKQAMEKLNSKVPGMDNSQILSLAGVKECQDAGALAGLAGIGLGSSSSAILNRDPDSLSCGELKKEKGIEAMLKDLKQGKESLIQANKSLNCAIAASSTLLKALDGYRTELDKTMTAAGTQLQQATQYLEDLKAKAEFTDKEVLPDLIQSKKDLEDFARSIDANVTAVDTGVRQLKNRKINLEQQKKAFQMTEAMSCFKNQVGSSTNAESLVSSSVSSSVAQTANAATCLDPVSGQKIAVSAFDHAVCLYEGRRAAMTGGGRANRRIDPNDRNARAAGDSAKREITQILNEMIGGVPNAAALGAAGEKVAQNQTPKLTQYRNLTPADIKRNFESRLRRFDVGGANISQFVLGQVQKCYDQAKGAMENAATLKSSPIGLEADAIITQEASLKAMNQTKFKEAQMLFERVNSATTRHAGGGASMNISACEESQVEGQLSCLQKIRTTMTGLLTGQNALAMNTLRIQGTNKANTQEIKCAGVSACINVLRTYRADLATESASGQQKIAAFKTQIDGNLRSQIASEATKVNAFSQAIQNQVRGVSSILAGLGIMASPKFSKAEVPQITTGANDMPVLPSNLGALMGSLAQPPLQDLDESSVEKVQAAVGKKLQAVQDLEVALRAKISECKGEAKKDLVEVSQLYNRCVDEDVMCGKDPEGKLLTSINDVLRDKKLLGTAAFEQGIVALHMGVDSKKMCDARKVKQSESLGDFDTIITQLQNKLTAATSAQEAACEDLDKKKKAKGVTQEKAAALITECKSAEADEADLKIKLAKAKNEKREALAELEKRSKPNNDFGEGGKGSQNCATLPQQLAGKIEEYNRTQKLTIDASEAKSVKN